LQKVFIRNRLKLESAHRKQMSVVFIVRMCTENCSLIGENFVLGTCHLVG
jgi:hypothetical protein